MGSERSIHTGIRLASNDGIVSLEAHNGEVHFRSSLPAVGGDSFEPLVVPGVPLIRFLRALESFDETAVTIDWTNIDEVEVAAADASLRLHLLDVTTWPHIRVSVSDAKVLSAADLDRLRTVVFAASTDPQRGAATGVHVDNTTATATDQHRLAQSTLDTPLDEALVPATFLTEALRGVSADVRWVTDDRRATLLDERGFWSSVLLNQTFPKTQIRALLERPTEAVIHAPTDEFRRATEYVSVLGSERIELQVVGSGSAVVRTPSEEVGDVDATFPCDGDWIGRVWFNRKDLLSALQHHDMEVVDLSFTGLDKPVRIEGDRIKQVLLTWRAASA
jgi:DNA polymerase III sliding clamp (beta) subunit (PCNA family)